MTPDATPTTTKTVPELERELLERRLQYLEKSVEMLAEGMKRSTALTGDMLGILRDVVECFRLKPNARPEPERKPS